MLVLLSLQSKGTGCRSSHLADADSALPPVLAGRRGTTCLGQGPEAGHGGEAVQALAGLLRGIGGCGGRGVGRGASRDGSVVDVLAVDVDRVGDEGGAAMAAAGVALLEAEELDLGLDTLDQTGSHCDGAGSASEFDSVVERRW